MTDNQLLSRYLDTDGDGTGTKNAVGGTYTATPEEFYIQAQGGDRLSIARMIISIEDGSGVKPELYGAGAALTVGITVKVLSSTGAVIMDLTDGVPIKTNALWGSLCYDVDSKSWGNTPTDELVVVRWTFSKSGRPIILEDGQKLVVLLSDDMDHLINHYFLVQGFYENRGY